MPTKSTIYHSIDFDGCASRGWENNSLTEQQKLDTIWDDTKKLRCYIVDQSTFPQSVQNKPGKIVLLNGSTRQNADVDDFNNNKNHTPSVFTFCEHFVTQLSTTATKKECIHHPPVVVLDKFLFPWPSEVTDKVAQFWQANKEMLLILRARQNRIQFNKLQCRRTIVDNIYPTIEVTYTKNALAARNSITEEKEINTHLTRINSLRRRLNLTTIRQLKGTAPAQQLQELRNLLEDTDNQLKKRYPSDYDYDEEIIQLIREMNDIWVDIARIQDDLDIITATNLDHVHKQQMNKLSNQLDDFEWDLAGDKDRPIPTRQSGRTRTQLGEKRKKLIAQHDQLCQDLNKEERDINVKLGQYAAKAKELGKIYGDQLSSRSAADNEKIVLLYSQMHHAALTEQHADNNAPIHFYFYDDRDDILAILGPFYTNNPDFIPSNMTLHLRRHKARYDNKGVRKITDIQGTGAINRNYAVTQKHLLLTLEKSRVVYTYEELKEKWTAIYDLSLKLNTSSHDNGTEQRANVTRTDPNASRAGLTLVKRTVEGIRNEHWRITWLWLKFKNRHAIEAYKRTGQEPLQEQERKIIAKIKRYDHARHIAKQLLPNVRKLNKTLNRWLQSEEAQQPDITSPQNGGVQQRIPVSDTHNASSQPEGVTQVVSQSPPTVATQPIPVKLSENPYSLANNNTKPTHPVVAETEDCYSNSTPLLSSS